MDNISQTKHMQEIRRLATEHTKRNTHDILIKTKRRAIEKGGDGGGGNRRDRIWLSSPLQNAHMSSKVGRTQGKQHTQQKSSAHAATRLILREREIWIMDGGF